MADDPKKLLNTLAARIRHLIYQCTTLETKNKELNQVLAQKDAKIQELEQVISQLNTRYMNLKTARSVAGDDPDVKETKNRFNKLVREIDKCIALLNE